MSTIAQLAALAVTPAPIVVFDITSRFNGTVLRVSSLPVTFNGNAYQAIILRVSGFEVRLEDAELGVAGVPEIRLTLGNVNGAMSSWDNTNFFKNATLTATFLFVDRATGLPASTDSLVVFRGICNAPESADDYEMEISAFNRFNAELLLIPQIRIQQHSPTVFPGEGKKDSEVADPTDADTAVFAWKNSDSDRRRLDWPCGYGPARGQFGFAGVNPLGNFKLAQVLNANIFGTGSIGHTTLNMAVDDMKNHWVVITGGTGANQVRRVSSNTATTIVADRNWTVTPDATSDFAVLYGYCNHSKEDCKARGMYDVDSLSRTTRRFRGITFVPIDFRFRPVHGARRFTTSDQHNAKYNAMVPRVYGKVRLNGKILFTQSSNLIQGHLLFCEGEVQSLNNLIIEGKLIPKNLTSDAQAFINGNWLDRLGARGGNVQQPGLFLGHDPYNLFAMGFLNSLPLPFVNNNTEFDSSITVEGRLVERLDKNGASLGWGYSENPIWAIFDILKDTGWPVADINLQSLHSFSIYADQTIATFISSSATVQRSRFQISLVITEQRPVAELLRGMFGAFRVLSSYDNQGKLTLECENALANTNLSLAISATGTQFARVNDGAGIAVGKKLRIVDLITPSIAETVTVLSVRLTGNNFEFEANFTETYVSGSTVLGQTDFDFNLTNIVANEGRATIRRRSLPSASVPNEYIAEFQNAFREFSSDAVQLLDAREATEFGARVTAQLPAEGFTTVDAGVRLARLALSRIHGRRQSLSFVISRGNLFVELESSVKAMTIPIGTLVRLTWATENWSLKTFRVIGIVPSLDDEFPYWRIRYILREHDDEWYREVNGTTTFTPPDPTQRMMGVVGVVGVGVAGGGAVRGYQEY
jgi:Phage-related protein, tail component